LRVDFRKVTNKAKDFKIEKDDILFSGEFKKDKELVDISGKIINSLSVCCDRCGKEFIIKLDEEISIKVNDGVYKGKLEDFDVVEFYDGFIDFNDILSSELESIKLDYHLCDKCKEIEYFEKEF